MGDLTIVRLLRDINIDTMRLILKSIYLYQQIIVASWPHQRSFFVQQMMKYRNSRLVKVQRISVNEVLSHKWDIKSIPTPKTQGRLQRNGQKDQEIQSSGTTRTVYPDMTGM